MLKLGAVFLRVSPLRSTALVVLGTMVLALGVMLTLVWAGGSTTVSHTFTLQNQQFYWISHPAYSDFPATGQELVSQIETANPGVSAAVGRLVPGLPPAWECYPLTSGLAEDYCLASGGDPALCSTQGACNSLGTPAPPELTLEPRDGLLVRVVGNNATFTWPGTDDNGAIYGPFLANVDYLVSLPFNLAPYTADQLLTSLGDFPASGASGTVVRMEPGIEPQFFFWTGSNGNSFPQNFTVPVGEAVNVRFARDVSQGGLAYGGPGTSVSGRVFDDLDGSNTWSPGTDLPVAARKIILRGVPSGGVARLAIPDPADGTYQLLNLPDGDYTLEIKQISGETWSPSSPIPITISGGTPVTGLDLYRQPVHDTDLALYQTVPYPLRHPCSTSTPPGNQVTYCIPFANRGSFNENAARVVMHLPPTAQANYVSGSDSILDCASMPSPAFSVVDSTTLNWTMVGDFEPGDQCTVCVQVAVAAPPGDQLTTTAEVLIDGTSPDALPGSPDTATVTDNVLCSLDPNDLWVEPDGCGAPGWINPVASLAYRVRFQNDGTAPATRVQVTVALDAALDPASLEIVGSSHKLTGVDMLGDRRVVFTFDNINLPGSDADPAGSQGFLLYRVAPESGLIAGTRIRALASIVFDLNAPVLTNSVLTTWTTHALPVSGEPSPEICDAVDNDCDGFVDGFATMCGVGACAATGTCDAGVDSCEPGLPGTEVCDGLDDDCDGIADNIPIPSGDSVLTVLGGTLSWTPLGEASDYDVMRGDAAALSAAIGDYSSISVDCVVDDAASTTLPYSQAPTSGTIWWFLSRGENCGGAGTLGTDGRDAGVPLAPGSCP